MPTTTCCNTCDETQTVNVPGSAGNNAYTTTTANFTVPAIGSTVTISVGSTAWMAVGQKVFASDGVDFGNFEVQSIGGSTSFVGEFMGYVDDSASGTIASGAAVIPSGTQSSFTTTALKALNTTLLTGIGSFTDNTGGVSSDTLASTVGVHYWTFYTKLSDVTAAATVGAFTPGYRFKVLSLSYLGLQAGTGAGATITFTPTINGSGLTGIGAVTPTLANATAGSVVAGSTITGANTGTAAQTFAITAGTITAFTNGTGTILVKVQNLDTCDAFASLAAKINTIKAALQT